MELVLSYLKTNHVTTFIYVKEMWLEKGILATPDIASVIESMGISRHMYKQAYMSNDPYVFNGIQEFYRMCLGFLIYLIDQQEFDKIISVFQYVEMVDDFNNME